MRFRPFSSLVAVMAVACFGASAHATLLMENLFGPAPISGAITPPANFMPIGNTFYGAVGLNTGTTNYVFDKMHFFILNNNFSGNLLIDGGIYADSSGLPGILVQSFNTVVVPPTTSSPPQSWFFTTPSPAALYAGRDYWFVINARQSGSGAAFLWTGPTNYQPLTNYDGTASLGFLQNTAGGMGLWGLPGGGVMPGVAIEATAFGTEGPPIPEPTMTAVIVAGLCATRRRRR